MLTIEDWISELRDSKELKLVEGKKDKITLNKLGINNVIIIKQPLYKIVEDIAHTYRECILLVDLDKEGKKIYSYLKRNLERYGVKVIIKFRIFLFNNTNLSNIEGLINYIKNN